MNCRDLFQILNLEPTNDYSLIKSAYKREALKSHPDKNGGSNDRFNELSSAYELLSDEHYREMYYHSFKNNKDGNIALNNLASHQSSMSTNKFGKAWVKKDDFSIQKNSIYYDREVSYSHKLNDDDDDDEDYRKLTLYGFPNGRFSVTYYFPSTELFNELMNKREGFINFTVNNNRTDKWAVGIRQTDSKIKLLELMTIIDKHDPLNEIKAEIFGHLDLPLLRLQSNLQQSLLIYNSALASTEQNNVKMEEKKNVSAEKEISLTKSSSTFFSNKTKSGFNKDLSYKSSHAQANASMK